MSFASSQKPIYCQLLTPWNGILPPQMWILQVIRDTRTSDLSHDWETILACPICRTPFQSGLSQGSDITCAECGRAWPRRNGVPSFVDGQGRYWGEVSVEQMEQVLAVAESSGWRAAISGPLASFASRASGRNLRSA